MYLIEGIMGFIIILLLIRLLIRPNEVHFNQLFSVIFRITDPLLKPLKPVFSSEKKAVFLSIFVIVLARGLLYVTLRSVPVIAGIAFSFLHLLQLMFRFYMVVWFISVMTKNSYINTFITMIQRAFLPLSSIASRISVPRQHFSLFAFLFLIILYSFLSYLLYSIIDFGISRTGVPPFRGFFDALILITGLFPGFFSIVIIISALLSWVSPDPSNPVVQTIYGISEPLLTPFRKMVPNFGGLDVSPIIALLCFQIGGKFVQQIIYNVMSRL